VTGSAGARGSRVDDCFSRVLVVEKRYSIGCIFRTPESNYSHLQ